MVFGSNWYIMITSGWVTGHVKFTLAVADKAL